MIPEELKKYIDELINEKLEEQDGGAGGSTSTTGNAGGYYNSKYAFGRADISTYTKDGFTKVKKTPKHTKTYDVVPFKESKLHKIVEAELLKEISYRRFNENVSKISSERKIVRALHEVTKRIKEIEQVIEYSQRLKTENTIKKESFWTSKTEQLGMLSEKLNDLSNKIRTLSK
jgi:hypothetical protein